jgi:poly(A)-specific ribonuclease
MCQASSINFLINQDFDFNKLFKYGISYLNADDEEKLVKCLKEKQNLKKENTDIIPISDTDRPKIEEIWYYLIIYN